MIYSTTFSVIHADIRWRIN